MMMMSSPGSFDECRLSARWPPTLRPNQPTWAVSPPIVGCYHPQTPSPFIIITQLISWYSFYRPTEGGRLSRPRHCSKGAQPMPKAVYHSDCRDKHDTIAQMCTLPVHGICVMLWQKRHLPLKSKTQSQPAIEMGTQNNRLHVDYDWLPKEVLQELSK